MSSTFRLGDNGPGRRGGRASLDFHLSHLQHIAIFVGFSDICTKLLLGLKAAGIVVDFDV